MTNTNLTNPQDERAQNEFELAKQYAFKSNSSWEKAGEFYSKVKQLENRLTNWKNILSTAPILAMNVAFIPICIAEYFFSREIYREIAPKAPWAIAIGLISFGVVISEFLVYKLFPQKRDWKKYELRKQNENKSHLTDEHIESEVNKYSNNMAIIGTILSIVIIALIYFFSKERASREIEGGIRENPFGIQDLMPIGLYVFEILTGCFIWYSIRKISNSITLHFLKKNLNREKKNTMDFSALFEKKLKDAEEFGINKLENVNSLNTNVNALLYRSTLQFTDDETFFKEPAKETYNISLQFHNAGIPLKINNVDIYTQFKVALSVSTNSDGKAMLKLDTYPGDKIVKIILTRNIDNNKVTREITGSYSISEKEINIDWG